MRKIIAYFFIILLIITGFVSYDFIQENEEEGEREIIKILKPKDVSLYANRGNGSVSNPFEINLNQRYVKSIIVFNVDLFLTIHNGKVHSTNEIPVHLFNSSNVIIRDLIITSSSQETFHHGVNIVNSSKISLINLQILNTNSLGVHSKHSSELYIYSNFLYLNKQGSISLYNLTNSIISRNEINVGHPKRGLEIRGGENVLIEYNRIHNSTGDVQWGAELIETFGIRNADKYGNKSNNIVIRHNLVYDGAEDGIELVGNTNSIIQNNTLWGIRGQCIDIHAINNNITIANNHLLHCELEAFQITNAQNLDIFDNIIKNVSRVAIFHDAVYRDPPFLPMLNVSLYGLAPLPNYENFIFIDVQNFSQFNKIFLIDTKKLQNSSIKESLYITGYSMEEHNIVTFQNSTAYYAYLVKNNSSEIIAYSLAPIFSKPH